MIRLVIAGPVGVGKTTAVRSMAAGDPVRTEVALPGIEDSSKLTTTAAMDFSNVVLPDGRELQVYGMPGQERFGYSRSILLSRGDGVLLLLDGSDPDIELKCSHWLSVLDSRREGVPLVIGVTHTDLAPYFTMQCIRDVLGQIGADVPAFQLDARNRDDCFTLLSTTIEHVSATARPVPREASLPPARAHT